MKFIKLASRGGNYLVVASNVAWLRTGENGQTLVGMVGGAPLLVTGSVEEIAAQILDGVGQQEPAPVAAI
jgi:periplasmic protein TonB